MVQEVFIPHKFPSLNDYIASERKHRMIAAKMKKEWTGLSAMYFKNLKAYDRPIIIGFHWVEQNSRRDPDNIIFAKKFILDGLVVAGIIPDDTQKWIIEIHDSWEVDKKNVGVKIVMTWAGK